MKILMCIPNISEGRNLKIVEQVVAATRRALSEAFGGEPEHFTMYLKAEGAHASGATRR